MSDEGIPPMSRALAAARTEWLQHMGSSRRLQRGLDLTSEWLFDSKRALRALRRDAAEHDVVLEWIKDAYGAELADGVRRHCAASGRVLHL